MHSDSFRVLAAHGGVHISRITRPKPASLPRRTFIHHHREPGRVLRSGRAQWRRQKQPTGKLCTSFSKRILSHCSSFRVKKDAAKFSENDIAARESV